MCSLAFAISETKVDWLEPPYKNNAIVKETHKLTVKYDGWGVGSVLYTAKGVGDGLGLKMKTGTEQKQLKIKRGGSQKRPNKQNGKKLKTKK